MIDLTRGEKDCFERLQELDNEIYTLSIHEIAEHVHYSPATINRLMKKLGYNSIKEYKYNLFFTSNPMQEEADYLDILHTVIDSNYDQQFSVIQNWLEASKKVHVVGLDASNSVAISIFRGLGMHGYEADLYSSGGIFYAYATENVSDSDLIFVCSYSCGDIYLCSAIKSIKQYSTNAKIILITTKENNQINDYCDLTISTNTYQYDSIYRVITPLAIIGYKLLKYLEYQKQNIN